MPITQAHTPQISCQISSGCSGKPYQGKLTDPSLLLSIPCRSLPVFQYISRALTQLFTIKSLFLLACLHYSSRALLTCLVQDRGQTPAISRLAKHGDFCLSLHCSCRFLSMSRPQRMNTFYFLEPDKQKPDPSDTSETAHWMQFAFEQNLLIRRVWSDLFQSELGDIPEVVTVPGSGQFAVTSRHIRQHPRVFYQVRCTCSSFAEVFCCTKSWLQYAP